MSSGEAGAGFAVVFFLFFVGLWLASIVFWIVKIVEVAKIPDYQFKAAGTDKIVWILVVVLVGIIGALIWHFAKRRDVLAAYGRAPAPPPGWYPVPGGGMRWWDGSRWAELPPPPPGP